MNSPFVVPLDDEQNLDALPIERRPRLNESGWGMLNIHCANLTVYLPESGKATGCGVVICPGGGYGAISMQNEGHDIARWLSSFGVAGFILQYRLPADYPFPATIIDAQRAIRLVRARAVEWGIRTERVGIAGFSAGGHLAATAANLGDLGNPVAEKRVQRESARPDFAILGYPVIAFSKEYCHAGTRESLVGPDIGSPLVREMSMDLQVSDKTPPTFLFHSTNDGCVDSRNSIDFYLACKAKGVPVALHLFVSGDHGYGLGDPRTDAAQWPTLCQRWMRDLGLLNR